MNTAVIEFDPLTDPVRTAAQNHDFFLFGPLNFVFAIVGRIVIRRVGRKLCSAGINGLIHGQYTQCVTLRAHHILFESENMRYLAIAKSPFFRAAQEINLVKSSSRSQFGFTLNELQKVV